MQNHENEKSAILDKAKAGKENIKSLNLEAVICTTCGNLAQGDGLVTLTSQAPATPGLRTKLRASRTIETIA
jgi:hypothetical protein